MKDVNKVPFNWEKIKSVGLRAGKEALALAEATFRTLKDPALSWKHRGVLIAALVYFISPLDGVPDFLPGGYLDDISILVGALMGVGSVAREHWRAARDKYGLLGTLESQSKGHPYQESSSAKKRDIVEVQGRRIED